MKNITTDGLVREIDAEANINGTCLVGHIDTKYSSLLDTFGEPNSQWDEYKTDAEWIINTPDGIATIYNYKDGKNYNGQDGLETHLIKDWHIGGHTDEVVRWIERAIDNYTSDLPF